MTKTRARPRFSRTIARARWDEYRELLELALACGYRVMSLESWFDAGHRAPDPTLLLRHDVDQHPRSVLPMMAIERALGLSSTWYFRWRTAHPAVIKQLRANGFAVGLHYETLSRRALARRLSATQIDDALIQECRLALASEAAAFTAAYGPIHSICPHGDSRIPFANNALLVRGRDPQEFGVRWDGHESLRGQGLGFWLTDRSAPEGRWKDRTNPSTLFEESVSPILCLTHPNNWASGLGLWTDRALRPVFRALVAAGLRANPIVTGSDKPRIRDE